ncbi:NUDIX hydrolase [Candidatus Micrarchaeota archaeon]|nr:NUDIX hydrolase [Candidatus Micrarchaeota archaeon]
MRTNKRIQAIVFKNERVLLIQKKDLFSTKKYWRLPKGGIEEGENDLETLKRELKEETGITEIIEPKKVFYYEVSRNVPQKITTYVMKTTQEPATPSEAISEGIIGCKWFEPKQALQKLFFKEEKQALEKALE